MHTKLRVLVAPLLLAGIAALPSGAPDTVSAPALFHPHFQKKLECKVTSDVTVTVRYQTVTFDTAGAKKMKPGEAWHLAGASFETSADLVIGGQNVEAGAYALSARKAKGGKWELTLHEGRGFSRPGQDGVHVLETEFDAKSTMYEHMCIDVQPAGDKKTPRLSLEVRFDEMLARALIEVPEKK